MKEKIRKALEEFFNIGDSYTYELTRVKEAFSVGTVTLDDFVEWGEEEVNNLCDYLCDKLQSKIPKWHLCSEELPKTNGWYLTQYKRLADHYSYDVLLYDKEEWHLPSYLKVVAWMELPKFEESEK